MYTLKNETKRNIEKNIGISIDELKSLTVGVEKNFIEKQTGKPLVFSKNRRHSIVGRGNPLLARKKIRTMKDVDQKLSKILEG